MADNSRPVAEPLQKSAQAAQAVRGAVKTGKAIAGAAKGAAAGGVWGAVAGFAWENRKFVGKVIIAATAVLMIPILILCMLPGIIFGGFGNSHSPADPDTPIMNSSAAIDSNLVEISTAVSCVLSEALTDTLTAIENDYAACTADGKEVINPYESSPNFNANLFVGQYCAAKNEDYAAVSVSDMESMLRSGKDKLYSYTKKEEERTVETVTTSVTVDASTGKETTTETVTTTTEKWIIYTVSYNGEAYFADEVFHLTAEQKDLADDYAYNLSLFLGDSMFQGLPAGYTTVSSLGNIRFTDGQTEVVYFNQLDERYAGQPYGTDNIGGYGCGPTCMAMVVSSLTDDLVDPVEMAKWSYEHGYWCSGSGSYHALIPAAAEAWGLPVSGCTASEPQRITDALSSGKLIVALEGAWQPWSFHDESDTLVGYDVEVSRAIAEKLGVEPEYVESDWDSLFAGLDAGRYDIVCNGVEVTDERAKTYDFTEPYGYIHTALAVRKDNEDITSFEDLKGKTTANSLASTYMELAESYGATVQGIDTLEETIQLLTAGRIDATLNADVSFYDYLNVHPDADFKLVAQTEEASHVGIPVLKSDDTSFLDALNSAIEALRADGTLKELSEKYFGEDISSEN